MILSDVDKATIRLNLVEALLEESEKSLHRPRSCPRSSPQSSPVTNRPTRYEFKSKDERGLLNGIVERSFHLPLAQRLVDPRQHSLEAVLMLKQILKIFWSCTQFYLPGNKSAASVSLSNPQSMQPRFDILRTVLAKPLPEASTGPRTTPPTHLHRGPHSSIHREVVARSIPLIRFLAFMCTKDERRSIDF